MKEGSALKKAKAKKRMIRKLALKVLVVLILLEPGKEEEKIDRVEKIAKQIPGVKPEVVRGLLHYLSTSKSRKGKKGSRGHAEKLARMINEKR